MHFVRTDERSERYAERIQAELGPVIGHPLNPEAMDRRLSHFYGSDNFEALRNQPDGRKLINSLPGD